MRAAPPSFFQADRDAETITGAAEAIGDRHAAVLERERCERVRRDHLDAVSDRETRCIRIDDESRKSLCTRRFARADEDNVMISDAAVRNPGLATVDAHMIVPVRNGGGRERGDIRAGLQFREGEGGDALAARDGRKVALLQCFIAEQRDRAGAEPLHREGEIGEPVMKRENLASETQCSHVEIRCQSAVSRRHGGAQEPGLAERSDTRAAGGIDVVMRQMGKMRACPTRKVDGKGTVPFLEERPGKRFRQRRHRQFPSKTGFDLAAKAW